VSLMRLYLPSVIALSALLATSAIAQAPSTKYEPGTVVSVARHPDPPNQEPGQVQYDVSIRVGDTVYVCLYSPPNGANFVEYSSGFDLLVLVKNDTLTFPSKLTGTTTVPIIRKETLPSQPVLDWSKAPSQYFEMKMRNLTDALDLTEDQQQKIKPILQQETFEAGAVCFNPSIPRKQRMSKWTRIVEASDTKLRPLLVDAQWSKLQEMRSEQKKELKKLISEHPDDRKD
jgi:Spy/CpxP family protein refolding chaperone